MGTQSGSRKAGNRWWLDPAWYSGAYLPILAECDSDRNFYRRLGAAVLLLSCFSGVALAFGLGYVLDTSPASLWWAGLGWAVFLACGVEPLVLQISPTRKWAALALAIAWRVALSLLLAAQLSEPVILAINEPEINQQLQIERSQSEAETIADAKGTFGPRIAADQAQLQKIRGRVADLQHKVAHYESVAGTVEDGACGPRCRSYRELARQDRQRLLGVSKRNDHRQDALHGQLDHWREKLHGGEAEGKAAIDQSEGLWARMRAMDAIAARGGEQAAEIWALRLLLVVLDLLPLSAKLFRLATVDSPYERLLAARRAKDRLKAKGELAEADVAEAELEARTRAEKEVMRARINRETDLRISEIEFGEGRPGPTPGGERVPAWNLKEYVRKMGEPHERRAVDVPPELTRVGFVGAAILGAMLLLAVLVGALQGHLPAGTLIVAVAFVAAAVLGAVTHGFRRANAWGLRAILASFLVGLLLPPLFLVMNL